MIQKIMFALGAVAAFEGLLLAIAPQRTLEAIKYISQLSERSRSNFGLIALGVGVILLWFSDL